MNAMPLYIVWSASYGLYCPGEKIYPRNMLLVLSVVSCPHLVFVFLSVNFFFFSPHQTKKRRSSSSPPLLVNGKTCLCECFFAEAMPSSVSLSPFRVPVAVPAGISPDACPPGGQRPKTNKIVFIAFHPTSDYFSI